MNDFFIALDPSPGSERKERTEEVPTSFSLNGVAYQYTTAMQQVNGCDLGALPW
jgi:hypothetical protein